MSTDSHTASLLLYCRAGFERECAAEALANLEDEPLQHYGIFEDMLIKDQGLSRSAPYDVSYGEAYVVVTVKTQELVKRVTCMKFSSLVFARQLCILVASCDGFANAADRVGPLVDKLSECFSEGDERLFSKLVIECPDTNEGKKLQKFCSKFALPLGNRLKREGFKQVFSRKDLKHIHIFFTSYEQAYLAYSLPGNASPFAMGIPRLKTPADVPSRSSLKLDEAFLSFMSEEERTQCLQEGMSAVDLGAAPGGWTYQLLRRGLSVTAVDNGKMADQLYEMGPLRHLREDAFKFAPSAPVDWLVCDMVESPRKVASLVAKWFERGYCRFAVVNFKLPMKRRLSEVASCLQQLCDEVPGLTRESILVKQLYHDREEVTLYIKRAAGAK